MAKTKVLEVRRKHYHTQKRCLEREASLTIDPIQPGPSPADIVEQRDQLDHFHSRLAPKWQCVLLVLYMGASVAEAAETSELSVRSVERWLEFQRELHAARQAAS